MVGTSMSVGRGSLSKSTLLAIGRRTLQDWLDSTVIVEGESMVVEGVATDLVCDYGMGDCDLGYEALGEGVVHLQGDGVGIVSSPCNACISF